MFYTGIFFLISTETKSNTEISKVILNIFQYFYEKIQLLFVVEDYAWNMNAVFFLLNILELLTFTKF